MLMTLLDHPSVKEVSRVCQCDKSIEMPIPELGASHSSLPLNPFHEQNRPYKKVLSCSSTWRDKIILQNKSAIFYLSSVTSLDDKTTLMLLSWYFWQMGKKPGITSFNSLRTTSYCLTHPRGQCLEWACHRHSFQCGAFLQDGSCVLFFQFA